MSKIGDLIVRMKLDYQDYEKGLKKTKKSTSDMGSSMGKMFSSVAGKFLTLTTAVAALGKTIKDAVNSNQVLGDAWASMTAQMTAAWNTFTSALGSFNFNNFTSRLSDTISKAKELYNAIDAMGENDTSYNMLLSSQQAKINNLRIALDDVNRSDEERIKAGEELLKIYSELEQNRTRGLSNVNDATLDMILADMGIKVPKGNEEIFRKTIAQFFMWLGTEQGEMVNNEAKKIAANVGGVKNVAGQQWLDKMQSQGVNRNVATWAVLYNQFISEDDRKAMEKAYTEYNNQLARFDEETRRYQTKINNLKHKSSGGSGATAQTPAIARDLGGLPALAGIAGPEVTSGIDETIAGIDRLMAKYEEMGEKIHEQAEAIRGASEMMTNALVDGMISGVEELGYAVAGLNDADAGTVVKALLSPLADAAISAGVLIMTTGEALEAIKAAFKDWFGGAGMGAVAAGAALVAVGTAAKVGLAAIGSGKKSTSYANSSSYRTSGEIGTMNSALTVYVKGKLKGPDIILSGQSTQNSWRR